MLYMVTWIPSIYHLYVSIYTSTMDPMVLWVIISQVHQIFPIFSSTLGLLPGHPASGGALGRRPVARHGLADLAAGAAQRAVAGRLWRDEGAGPSRAARGRPWNAWGKPPWGKPWMMESIGKP